MNMEYIRKTYNVPAKRGGKVIYSGNGSNLAGVITGAHGGYLRIRLDGDKFSCKFHPVWRLTYLAAPKEQNK